MNVHGLSLSNEGQVLFIDLEDEPQPIDGGHNEQLLSRRGVLPRRQEPLARLAEGSRGTLALGFTLEKIGPADGFPLEEHFASLLLLLTKVRLRGGGSVGGKGGGQLR